MANQRTIDPPNPPGLPGTEHIQDPNMRTAVERINQFLMWLYRRRPTTVATPQPSSTVPAATQQQQFPFRTDVSFSQWLRDRILELIRPYIGVMSVLINNYNVSLVNDQDAPGGNKVYGTDNAGVKGWKPESGGSVEVKDSITKDTNGVLMFVNDVDQPGVYYVYGTNAAGVKAWMQMLSQAVVTNVSWDGTNLVQTKKLALVLDVGQPYNETIDTAIDCPFTT